MSVRYMECFRVVSCALTLLKHAKYQTRIITFILIVTILFLLYILKGIRYLCKSFLQLYIRTSFEKLNFMKRVSNNLKFLLIVCKQEYFVCSFYYFLSFVLCAYNNLNGVLL